MYEINLLMYIIVWAIIGVFSQFSPYGKKVALDGSKSIFLIQHFVRIFNSSTFKAVHLCIQLTTIVQKFFNRTALR
jgi:hypothetical protein